MPRKKRNRSPLREAFGAFGQALSIARAGGEVLVAEADEMAALAEESAGWSRLTGSDRDLTSWDQTRMQEVAFHLYRKSHLAKRILGLIEDFVVGDGIQVTADNDAVQDAIADFWDDPVNAMDRLNGMRVREWQLWGEICLPVTEARGGFVRIGWIDPQFIDQVLPNPRSGLPGQIVLTSEGARSARKEVLKVISWDDEKAEFVGDCFFGSINCPLGGRRGVSELYAAADWIDAHEEVLFTQIDRARLLNSHIWDVELMGANQTKIDAWLKKHGKPPEPGSIRAHNEKIKWTALSPQLGAYEVSRQAKDLQDYILGGLGIPSHWYGAGDSENLATAAVMGEPARKMLKRKQKEYTFLLRDIISYSLWRRKAAGTLAVPDEDLDKFTVTIPDFSGPDIAKVGSSVSQLIAAVSAAEDAGYVAKDTARSLVAILFSELGAEIDPDDEAEKVEDASNAADQKDEEKAVAAEERRLAALRKVAERASRVNPADNTGGGGSVDE